MDKHNGSAIGEVIQDSDIAQVLREWYDDDEIGSYIVDITIGYKGDDNRIRVEAMQKGCVNNFDLDLSVMRRYTRFIRDNNIDDPDEMDSIIRGFTPVPMQRSDPDFPKVVCLCGSTGKALADFREQNARLTFEGCIVLSIGVDTKSDDELFANLNFDQQQEKKRALDILHLRKIDLADEVMILNRNGYIGESTMRELKYAISLKKPIVWLEPDRAIVTTP